MGVFSQALAFDVFDDQLVKSSIVAGRAVPRIEQKTTEILEHCENRYFAIKISFLVQNCLQTRSKIV
jgi:hypothetical protein